MAVSNSTLIKSLTKQQNALEKSLAGQRTDAQRRQQAESEYQSYYDQLRLAQQQAYDTNDMLLQQQRAGLSRGYDRQREETANQFAQTYSQADNQMLGRGMQRSSYGAQVLAGIGNAAARAQSDIYAAQTEAEGNIDAQRTQLGAQHNQQMSQYTASQQADIMKRIAELEANDHTNYLNDMGSYLSVVKEIAALLKQNKSSGGGGGVVKKNTTTTTDGDGNTDTSSILGDIDAALSGIGNAGATAGSAARTGSLVGVNRAVANVVRPNPAVLNINERRLTY